MTDSALSATVGDNPGKLLQLERERRGLTVAQVAGELHMDSGVARALEAGDFASLGAPIFVKGHLRNYAKLLGMDGEKIVQAYEACATPETPTLVTHRTTGEIVGGSAESSGWLSWVGGIVVLLLVVLFGLWWLYSPAADNWMTINQLKAPADTMRQLPLEPAAGTGDSEANSTPADAQTEVAMPLQATTDQPAVTSPEQNALPVQDEALITAGTPDAQNEPVQQSASAEPSVTEPATAETAVLTAAPAVLPPKLIVTLRFTGDSWAEVYDASGEPLFYSLGAAGSARTIEARPPVRVFLGNAPAVEVLVNGSVYEHEQFERTDNTARFTLRAE